MALTLWTASGPTPAAAERLPVTVFTVAEGLARDWVTAIAPDSAGFLWLATAEGLSRFDGREFVNYGTSHGLTHRWVSGVLETRAGEYWVGTRVEIAYLGLSFTPGESLRYQYRLVGGNEAWSPPTSERRVEYAGLGPGAYRFEVRAVSADGTSTPLPARVAVRVLAPVWQRPWFLAAAFATLALALAAVYRSRVSRLLAIERVRTHIAADLHDDIGSGLSQIALLSEVVRLQAGKAEPEMAGGLEKIAGLSRRLLESMGDIVWAINPKRDHVTDLAHRMRRFASDLLAAHDVELRFSAPPPEAERAIGADLRRHTYLVFKEAIHNAARHSACRAVDVELHVERDRLRLCVRDDGRGLDPARPSEGHGLANMRRRAEQVRGSLEIGGDPERGTTVLLEAPLRGAT